MQAVLASKIESGTARAASGVFAFACAYAAYEWLAASLTQPADAAASAAAAAIAFLCCARALTAVGDDRERLPTPAFEVRDYAPNSYQELLLTDRYEPEQPSEPLILDDILAQIEPNSRVVSLFDRDSMPTPAQLKSRIDAHLGRGPAGPPPADASQALHDALAELRRSMR